MTAQHKKPTKTELQAAQNTTIPDILRPGLDVVFCGINPGLYTAAIGHHFGRPGNRFWKVLHLAGFTPSQLSPYDDGLGPTFGFGLTNVVARATARADELSPQEIRAGGQMLAAKLAAYRPRYVAFAGMQAYRVAFEHPTATVGKQSALIGDVVPWVLPNPSGLQAHYQLDRLVELFGELREAIESSNASSK